MLIFFLVLCMHSHSLVFIISMFVVHERMSMFNDLFSSSSVLLLSVVFVNAVIIVVCHSLDI